MSIFYLSLSYVALHNPYLSKCLICRAQNNFNKNQSDSEDENEDGDYTVYECPGLAPVSCNIIFLEDFIELYL